MLLQDLLKKINEEVKANPKVLSFEVRLDQYENCNSDGTVEAEYIVVKPKLYRGDTPVIVIG